MKSTLILSAAALSLLSACGSMSPAKPMMFSQAALPDAVKVPAGQKVTMETVGVGEITYECREKQMAGQPVAGQFEWVFVGPVAVLKDRSGKAVGKYYGPPATWEAMDGSKVAGAQVAIAPATPGSIPLQLVKANPAMGQGAMTGVSYIQRVATKGGVAPAAACGMESKGKREIVKYEADYIFWATM